jgi:hypothetical protein
MPGVFHFPTEETMAKPNYNFEKRPRELAKKKKQDEKLRRKREKNSATVDDAATPPSESTSDATPDAAS